MFNSVALNIRPKLQPPSRCGVEGLGRDSEGGNALDCMARAFAKQNLWWADGGYACINF